MHQLRDYQLKAIEQIKSEFQKGIRKILYKSPTGSGKGTVCAEIMRMAAEKGNSVLFLVRGRHLVIDTSQRLFKIGVEHGTLLAGHWNIRTHLPIQVASVDTVIARKILPPADLIIIDEADLATSKKYRDVISKYPNSYILSVTATPEVSESIRHIADTVVNPITAQELTDQGYLAPLRYFAPSSPDLTKVQVSSSTKDYVNNQLEPVMNQLTGNIISHWIKHSIERPTLLFATNIHHSKILMQRFLDSGIQSEHVDALDGDDGRKESFDRLKNGTTKVLCTVGIATRGVDLPYVSCLILARPTLSRRLHIQMLGRGSRICEGKTDTIILDHSGNIIRHGTLCDEIEVNLDGKKNSEHHITLSKTCKQCFAVFRGVICPECKTEPPKAEAKIIEESDEELSEVDPVLMTFKSLLREAKSKKRKSVWAMHKLVQKYGLDKCRPYLPSWFLTNQGGLFGFSPFESVTSPGINLGRKIGG